MVPLFCVVSVISWNLPIAKLKDTRMNKPMGMMALADFDIVFLL
jgi:hypothetical protein